MPCVSRNSTWIGPSGARGESRDYQHTGKLACRGLGAEIH